jgi:hypothetical protein
MVTLARFPLSIYYSLELTLWRVEILYTSIIVREFNYLLWIIIIAGYPYGLSCLVWRSVWMPRFVLQGKTVEFGAGVMLLLTFGNLWNHIAKCFSSYLG